MSSGSSSKRRQHLNFLEGRTSSVKATKGHMVGRRKVKKEEGRPCLPFVSPRPAWPTPHSPDLLSPTSACCNYYRDVIQIPEILTQGSKQVAVWTQLWGAHSPIQHKVLVVRKVGGIVRERPLQNFITAIVWCLFRGVRWMWSPRANQGTCLVQKALLQVRQWPRSQHVQRSYTTSLFHLRFSLTKERILHFPAKQAGDLPESGVQLHWALFLSFLFQTAPQHITASFHF